MSLKSSANTATKVKLFVLILLIAILNLGQGDEDCCPNEEDGQSEPDLVQMNITVSKNSVRLEVGGESEAVNVSVQCSASDPDYCPTECVWTGPAAPSWLYATYADKFDDNTTLSLTLVPGQFARSALAPGAVTENDMTNGPTLRLVDDLVVHCNPQFPLLPNPEQAISVTKVNPRVIHISASGDEQTLEALRQSSEDADLEIPAAINFGDVALGFSTDWWSVPLCNRGLEVLSVESVEILAAPPGDHTNDFERESFWAPAALPRDILPSECRYLGIRFVPKELGQRRAVVRIETDSEDEPVHSLQVKGVGVEFQAGGSLASTALELRPWVNLSPAGHTNWRHLAFGLSSDSYDPRLKRLTVMGKNQAFDLTGQAEGALLGRILLRQQRQHRFQVLMRLLKRVGPERWTFRIGPDDPQFGHIPLARGILENRGDGFHLEITASDRVLDPATGLLPHQQVSAEFRFDVPLRIPARGDISYLFSLDSLDASAPAAAGPAEVVVSR